MAAIPVVQRAACCSISGEIGLQLHSSVCSLLVITFFMLFRQRKIGIDLSADKSNKAAQQIVLSTNTTVLSMEFGAAELKR